MNLMGNGFSRVDVEEFNPGFHWLPNSALFLGGPCYFRRLRSVLVSPEGELEFFFFSRWINLMSNKPPFRILFLILSRPILDLEKFLSRPEFLTHPLSLSSHCYSFIYFFLFLYFTIFHLSRNQFCFNRGGLKRWFALEIFFHPTCNDRYNFITREIISFELSLSPYFWRRLKRY